MTTPEPQPGVGWSVRDVVWASFFGLALFGILVLAAALAGHRLGMAAGAEAPYLRGVLVALFELVLIVPVWAFALRRPGVGWRDLGLRSFRPLTGCLAALALLYLAFSVNLVWSLILRRLGWPGQPEVLPLFGQGVGGLLLALLAVGVIAPFVEELFFRGFAFPALRQRFGLVRGIAINAALFTLPHFTPTVFPPIFVLGVFFCLLYEHTASIWPGVLLHASINTLAVLAAYLVGR